MTQEPFLLEKPYDGIFCVARGRNGRICILKSEWLVALEIIKEDRRESTVPNKYFGRWRNGEYLGSDAFRNEGTYKSGFGQEYKIYAFKGRQLRMYGSEVLLGGVNTFLITMCMKKKQNKMKTSDGAVASKRIGTILMS
ncbi:hypothetical protein [Fodinicurvata sp. EGI_FJ10296]|uniref:hypothetical protein n=1 Tax=Fodinicurvata sp. EGI_FJ10296 TaxID=3231908 RepID=UPI0034554291